MEDSIKVNRENTFIYIYINYTGKEVIIQRLRQAYPHIFKYKSATNIYTYQLAE